MSADRAPGQDPTEGLEMLVQRHASAVLGVCLAYTRNLGDAEDLVQETLVKAIASIDSLQNAGAVRHWLLQIARRVCINHCSRKRPVAPLRYDVAAPVRTVDPDIERLQTALSRLPQDYRETISMYYLDGRSCAAVAEALEISEVAVRVRLTRGRAMLHKLLKESDE